MKRLIFTVLLAAFSITGHTAPELKGSPQELREFLYPNDKLVTIAGKAEENAYSDRAIVSMVVTTEEKLLSGSISANAQIRKKLLLSH